MVFNPRFPNVFFLSQNIQCCHRESNGGNENKWVNSTYALKIFESFLESSKEEDCDECFLCEFSETSPYFISN